MHDQTPETGGLHFIPGSHRSVVCTSHITVMEGLIAFLIWPYLILQSDYTYLVVLFCIVLFLNITVKSFIRWSRNDQPLPITDASFGDMESIKKVTYICNKFGMYSEVML